MRGNTALPHSSAICCCKVFVVLALYRYPPAIPLQLTADLRGLYVYAYTYTCTRAYKYTRIHLPPRAFPRSLRLLDRHDHVHG